MDKPNKLARIVAAMDAAGVPMNVRDVTAALGLPVDRKNTAPVSGALHRLVDLGVVAPVHTYGPMQFRRVPGTAYTGKAIRAPRTRPDYRAAELSPAAKRVGATIIIALSVSKLFSSETKPTHQRLMAEFGMSRETAFRWLKGWAVVNGDTGRQPRRPAQKKAITAARPLSARL